MNDSPADSLTISSTDSPPAVTLTLYLDGEQKTLTMDPSEAVLAGGRLMHEGVQHLPAHKAFSVHPEPSAAPTPLTVAPPTPLPPHEEPPQEPPRSEAPVSVPPGYEAVLGQEAPREWRVTHSARLRGADIGVSQDEMIEAASFPDSIEHPNDDVRAHVKGRVSVLIPIADPDAIIGVTLVTREGTTADGASPPRGPSGGPGRKMPGDFAELRKMLLAHGFELDQQQKGHPKVTHPDHPGVVVAMSASPSDYRSYRNMIALIRRKFQVDITLPS